MLKTDALLVSLGVSIVSFLLEDSAGAEQNP